ncbi:MAG: peptidoglycan glycosyltransferase [Bernardetiaceae bacterium]|nr:peptidoglycan glycosyltransferase [Bernardetiaceae bacterium]
MYEARKYIIQFVILIGIIIYAIKLLSVQVLTEEHRLRAENISIHAIPEYPTRGLIYDRTGKLLVSNQPVYDIEIIGRKLEIKDTLAFCELFSIDTAYLHKKLSKANYGLQRFKRTLFIKQLSAVDYARIQDRLSDIRGLYPVPRTIRTYPLSCFASGLGYVKEIDQFMLDKDTLNYYKRGDLIGRSGLEASYEKDLRGKRGVHYIMYDRLGIARGAYKGGEYDTLPEMGRDLHASIDAELQIYGEKLMQNKIGAVVAIEPSTGEILALISAPTYDPNMLAGEGLEVSRNFAKLLQDPNKPLFNRAIQSTHPPGSTFKVTEALMALEDGVIDPQRGRISCIQDPIGCHPHPSPLDLQASIQHSCNPFYYRLFMQIVRQDFGTGSSKENERIGLQRWHDYAQSLGLGRKLGLDLPNEKPGLIPSPAYYDKVYKNRPQGWKLSNVYSLSIGQGEMGTVPLQLANLAAIIANRGYYYVPHLIKGIAEREIDSLYRTKQYTKISPKHFDLVANGMADVVRAGTARRAQIDGIEVCGKTGTVQNPHGEDHSIFISFAPKDNPKIAIAVIVENSGFGGTWAAPIASLMIEKYINREISEKSQIHKEKRILEADFIRQKAERDARKRVRDSLKRVQKYRNQEPEIKKEKEKKALPTELQVQDLKINMDTLPYKRPMIPLSLPNSKAAPLLPSDNRKKY